MSERYVYTHCKWRYINTLPIFPYLSAALANVVEWCLTFGQCKEEYAESQSRWGGMQHLVSDCYNGVRTCVGVCVCMCAFVIKILDCRYTGVGDPT